MGPRRGGGWLCCGGLLSLDPPGAASTVPPCPLLGADLRLGLSLGPGSGLFPPEHPCWGPTAAAETHGQLLTGVFCLAGVTGAASSMALAAAAGTTRPHSLRSTTQVGFANGHLLQRSFSSFALGTPFCLPAPLPAWCDADNQRTAKLGGTQGSSSGGIAAK